MALPRSSSTLEAASEVARSPQGHLQKQARRIHPTPQLLRTPLKDRDQTPGCLLLDRFVGRVATAARIDLGNGVDNCELCIVFQFRTFPGTGECNLCLQLYGTCIHRHTHTNTCIHIHYIHAYTLGFGFVVRQVSDIRRVLWGTIRICSNIIWFCRESTKVLSGIWKGFVRNTNGADLATWDPKP